MRNANLKVKLTGSFMLMALIIIVGGGIGWWGVYSTYNDLKEIAGVYVPGIKALGIMNEAHTSLQKIEKNLLIPEVYGNEAEKTRQVKLMETYAGRADKAWKVYEPLPKTAEEAALWNQLKPAWETWKKENAQAIELAKNGKQEEAVALSTGKAREAFYGSQKLLDELIEVNDKAAQAMQQHAESMGGMYKTLTMGGSIVGSVLAVFLGLFLSGYITRPIHRAVEGIFEGAEQVAAASGQVSAASQSLAEGASEQASALEETSSSLEEMSSMTRQNADNAGQAKSMMEQARGILGTVDRNMTEMTRAIDEITQTSEETGKIIKTIDEIAFQTNLLALNAAVEAARAGEAGAGFAVVANEVRNLAMRAAEAAKNTSTLIENTITAVKGGNELTQRTQQSFRENMDIVVKIGSLVDEIAAASGEQAQGIEQINKAVTEMDKVTQQTAANAEESASASEQMTAQAAQLRQHVEGLVSLIEGERSSAGRVEASAPPPAGHKGALRINREFPKPKPSSVPSGRKTTRPEEVIPFEEGNFKDF